MCSDHYRKTGLQSSFVIILITQSSNSFCLPGKSHRWRSLVGCSPWGCEESDTLSDLTFTFHFHTLEKEMATHSSVLAWRIPGTGEPGGLPSMGSHRVGHDWSDLAAANYWSVQFSRSVVSNSLRPQELQDARPPCPPPSPEVHSNSCPSSRWCHLATHPFSCPQSLPASESFPLRQLFRSGGQSIGVSALASVLPKNTQDWPPLEWTGWIS